MSTQQTAVAELYTALFNRAPDAGGLAFWVENITSGKLSLEQVSQHWMTQQAEALVAYPASLSNAEFIDHIYGNILGRTVDAGGQAFWLQQLQTGAISRDVFALAIVNSVKAQTGATAVLEAALLNNKAQVGVAFADKGLNDASLAFKVLTTVTADPDTVASTLAVIALAPSNAAALTAPVVASLNLTLDKIAALISKAPAELPNLATYLTTIANSATSSTDLNALLAKIATVVDAAATDPSALNNPVALGNAAVEASTPSTGGGGGGGGGVTPPPAKTFESTKDADKVTLTAGADTFVTKFGDPGIKQVSTITLSGTYETGDTVTITGVATDPILVTVNGPTTAAADIIAAVNAATGKTVVAAAGADGAVTLTANTAGTSFIASAVAANRAESQDGADDTQDATVSTSVPNKDAVAPGADTTQGVNLAHTVANTAETEGGADDTQSASSVTTVVNQIASPEGADDTQQASVASTIPNDATEGALVAQVDTITLSGTYEAGDTITIGGVAGAAIVVTVKGPDTVAADILAAVLAAQGATVTAVVGLNPDEITLTAITPGTGFTTTVSAANKPATAAVAQIDTITLGGTYEAGDTVTINGVADEAVTVTISSTANAAAEIIAAINGATGKTVTAVSTGPAIVTLTADAAGTPFSATVTAANKAVVPAVAQVDTLQLTGVYEAGDTVTINGVATAAVIITVQDPANVAAEILAAVNGADGRSVTAALTDANHVTLTAIVPGVPFTANVSAANKAGEAGTPQVDTIELSGTYEAGDTITITGVAIDPVLVTVKAPDSAAADILAAVNAATGATVTAAVTDANHVTLTANTAGVPFTTTVVAANKVGSAVGADDSQAAAITVSTTAAPASDSFSSVAALDVLTGFTIGVDKVDLFTFTKGPVAQPLTLTKVADVSTDTDLATQLATAFAGIGANSAGLVEITTGANKGIYLFANDGDQAFSATQDVVIQLVGISGTVGGPGQLTVGDYFA